MKIRLAMEIFLSEPERSYVCQCAGGFEGEAVGGGGDMRKRRRKVKLKGTRNLNRRKRREGRRNV
jgi:hypothetical protein